MIRNLHCITASAEHLSTGNFRLIRFYSGPRIMGTLCHRFKFYYGIYKRSIMYAVLLVATLFAIYAVVTEQTQGNMNSLSR